ncbi:MAG TPA: twin-arginine translocase subunit TatC [Vicinamibacterales bacterium]|nr:twin-arginine translocase subunit TatC [Vicinamibacterales bacterium]
MALVPFPNKARTPATDDDHDPDWDELGPDSDRGGKMSFLEHLDELRKRIVYALIAIVIGFLIACLFLTPIFNFIMLPMQAALGKGQTLIYTEPTEALMLYLKMAVLVGLLIASPGVMSQVWLFVAPGLYSNEKKLAIPFVLMSSFFFVTGAAFSHYIVFPLTWKFFQSFAGDSLTFMPRIEPAFGLYVKLMLTFGLIFQMPTLVLFLAKMGVITAKFLIKNMKYAILIMFIAGAVLSPGTDPVGQVLMAGPMFLLYVISIGLAWAFGKKKAPVVEETS